MTSRVRIVLGNASVADYPEAGGHWMYFLQYPLGLLALKHDVLWLEVYRKCGDHARDRQIREIFFQRLRQFGLEAQATLLCVDGQTETVELEAADIYGSKSRHELQEFIGRAD